MSFDHSTFPTPHDDCFLDQSFRVTYASSLATPSSDAVTWLFGLALAPERKQLSGTALIQQRGQPAHKLIEPCKELCSHCQHAAETRLGFDNGLLQTEVETSHLFGRRNKSDISKQSCWC